MYCKLLLTLSFDQILPCALPHLPLCYLPHVSRGLPVSVSPYFLYPVPGTFFLPSSTCLLCPLDSLSRVSWILPHLCYLPLSPLRYLSPVPVCFLSTFSPVLPVSISPALPVSCPLSENCLLSNLYYLSPVFPVLNISCLPCAICLVSPKCDLPLVSHV